MISNMTFYYNKQHTLFAMTCNMTFYYNYNMQYI